MQYSITLLGTEVRLTCPLFLELLEDRLDIYLLLVTKTLTILKIIQRGFIRNSSQAACGRHS